MTKPHWTTQTDQLRAIIHAPRFGILTDFDGTLCNFRPYPEMPRMSPRNADLIRKLAERLPLVALISGRGADELQTVADIPGASVVYVGNHGLEELVNGQIIVAPEALEWAHRLNAFYEELGEPILPGVRHQHKRVTMSVTYRMAENPAQVRLRLKEKLDHVNQKYGFLLHEGRTIWEVKPNIPLDKGTAITRLIDEYGLNGAIFLGDDLTDVPALQAIRTLRDSHRIHGLAVGVLGETDVPLVQDNADVLARSVEEVENIFAWILDNLPAA
jgi:trehalose 6-phosphate phosphatase